MIPSTLHRRRELPLTANGKVDRKALLALDAELAGAGGDEPPRTADSKAPSEVLR